jgi:adhesin transport system membrane fusion protein
MATKKKVKLNQDDLEFVSSLSRAALEKPTFKSQLMVWVVFLVLIFLVFWAKNTELDKIVRGSGKVVPSGEVRTVQNYEGGIVSEIFVRSGDSIEKGQTLLKLDNTQFASTFGEAQNQEFDLFAKSIRLKAEAFNKPFKENIKTENIQLKAALKREHNLYKNHLKQLKTSQNILDEKITQNNNELTEAYNQVNQLTRSHRMLKKEILLMETGVKEGYASEVDLLKLQREANEVYTKISSAEYSIPRIKSIITESKTKRTEAKQAFQNDAHEKLNEVLAKLEQIENSKTALEDKVKRTNIRSPVNGIISELLVNTIGQIVQPGSDIIKIIPKDDSLVLETKILPSDIGFIYPGLKAKVKFTAYDFAIYGGLNGTVEKISADTLVDEEGNSFYIASIKTERNYLGSESSSLILLPGMTATVDIIIGKHTILNYIIKPIIKAKELALRES